MIEILWVHGLGRFSIQAATSLLAWGVVAHLLTDWLFQTDWMAVNKKQLRHPAAWVHGIIYALGMLLVFSWYKAILLGLVHILIDTGKPIAWWCSVFKNIKDDPPYVKVWADQVLHVAIVAVVAILSVVWL